MSDAAARSSGATPDPGPREPRGAPEGRSRRSAKRRLDFRTILLVATKELLESIRDRRTLFVALVLPVLIYPIVTLGLGPVISMQKKKLAEMSQSVVLSGEDAAAVKALVLDTPVPSEDGAAMPVLLEVVRSDDPRRDLFEGKVQLWVEVPKGFADALLREVTGAIRVHYDASDDKSIEAWNKWRAAFDAAGRREMDARLARKGLPPTWRNPLHQDFENVAPPERTAAFVFGRILAMLLVLMTLTSSFYPAVDAVAGEKERGTMETLLVAPCGRTELVLGKFGAILVVTLAAALLNLASLAFTCGPLVGAMGTDRLPALQITWPVIGGILVLLLPLAALFSAVSLSLSTLARSVKEAQHYLSPLVMLVMPLAMVVILPNLPLTRTLAAVPVTNAVLFFRDLMLGRTEWGTTVIVMVSTFGFAALAIWASVLLFLREETLFRGPEGSGSPLRRPAPRAVPTAASAVFLFAASLAGLWYAQGAMPKDIAANVLITQIAVVLAPCVLLTAWMRLDVAKTFRLATPRRAGTWIAIAAAIPLGIALPIVSAAVQHAVAGDPAEGGAMAELHMQMKALVRTSHALPLALLLGVLPALCEELVFRGFVLSGFSQAWTSRRGAVLAVLATAAFFALSHVFPEKWANTFVIGVILGWLALRTGSLVPGILAHAIHNAAAVVAAKYQTAGWAQWLYGGDEGAGWERIACAAGISAILLVVVGAATRNARRDTAADGTGDGTSSPVSPSDPGTLRGTTSSPQCSKCGRRYEDDGVRASGGAGAKAADCPHCPKRGVLFSERDYGPFIAGIFTVGGLVIMPLAWGAMVDLGYVRSLVWSLGSCVVFLIAFRRDGTISWPRTIAAMVVQAVAMVIYHGATGEPTFAVGGILGFVMVIISGRIGVALANVLRKGRQ